MAQIAGAADNVGTRAGGHAFTPGWPVAAENRVSVGRAVGLRDRLPGVSDRTRRGETAFPAVVHAGSGVGRQCLRLRLTPVRPDRCSGRPEAIRRVLESKEKTAPKQRKGHAANALGGERTTRHQLRRHVAASVDARTSNRPPSSRGRRQKPRLRRNSFTGSTPRRRHCKSLLYGRQRLASHPSEGANFLPDGNRLSRECTVFHRVPIAFGSSAGKRDELHRLDGVTFGGA